MSTIDTRCKARVYLQWLSLLLTVRQLLGAVSNMPIYITATALGKLAHPEGEIVLTRAAASQGVIQMCPTLASCSLDEMMAAKAPGQVQWFQLYVNRDRRVCGERLDFFFCVGSG